MQLYHGKQYNAGAPACSERPGRPGELISPSSVLRPDRTPALDVLFEDMRGARGESSSWRSCRRRGRTTISAAGAPWSFGWIIKGLARAAWLLGGRIGSIKLPGLGEAHRLLRSCSGSQPFHRIELHAAAKPLVTFFLCARPPFTSFSSDRVLFTFSFFALQVE